MSKLTVQQLALATLVGGAVAFSASTAIADDTNSRKKMDMTALDADKDGAVSMDEGASDAYVKANFAKFDGNGDGKLDEAEFAAMDEESRRKMDSITESFGDLDTDGSGSLSKEELAANESFAAMSGDDMDTAFADMDMNQDGQIDDREAMDYDSRRKQQVEG